MCLRNGVIVGNKMTPLIIRLTKKANNFYESWGASIENKDEFITELVELLDSVHEDGFNVDHHGSPSIKPTSYIEVIKIYE